MKRRDPFDPFEPLDPPPGGLALLRERLERRDGRRATGRRLAWAVAAAVPAMAIVAAVLFLSHDGPDRPVWAPDPSDLVALGLVEGTGPPVVVRAESRGRVALQPIVETEEVIYYRVATLDR